MVDENCLNEKDFNGWPVFSTLKNISYKQASLYNSSSEEKLSFQSGGVKSGLDSKDTILKRDFSFQMLWTNILIDDGKCLLLTYPENTCPGGKKS